MWDETGMSKGYQMKDLSQAKGYFAIAPSQGVSSLLATLCQKPGDCLIGLDRTKPYIQYLLSNCQNLQQLTAYFTSPTQNWQVNPWQDIEVRDRLDTLTNCEGVQLEEMPLTENGEINLNLLFGGNSSFGKTARQQQQPRTQTEHQLVQIFEEVLKLSPVGIEDNFFELGGHSLLATQLVSRIRQTFEIDVPLTMVFQSSTIIELAERVDGIRSLLIDIQTAPSEDLKPGEEEIEL
ncbi:phosphopantetheine-binding protein [Okeania sp. SIO3B5]|uniref:phosphopantetheine-binding protein n=1 Tax=Okeania sp. SIO3B5 TaxID=2607811 RepID=UPI0035C8AC95